MSRRYESFIHPEASTNTPLTPGPVFGNNFRSAASTTDFDSIFIPIPTGVQVGDLLIATIAAYPNPTTINIPTGWTLLRHDNPGGTSMQLMTIWRRREAADSGSSLLVTTTGGTPELFGSMAAYFGVVAAPQNPINNTSGTVTTLGAGATSFTIASHTASEPGTQLVATYAYNINGKTFTPSTTQVFGPLQERVDQPGGAGFMSGGLADARLRNVDTVTGTTTVTFTPSALAGQQAIGQHITLNVENNNTYRDSTFSTTDAGLSVIIPRPNIMLDDIMLACISVVDPTAIITPPVGWASVRSDIQGLLTQQIFWKRADAADTVAVDFTFSVAVAADITGIVTSYFGCPTVGSPINGSAAAVENSTDITTTIPSITPTQEHTMYVAFYSVQDDGRTWAANLADPAMIEREDANATLVDVSVGLSDERRYFVNATPVRQQTHSAIVGAPPNRDKIGQVVLLNLAPTQFSVFEGDPLEVEDYEGIRIFSYSDVPSGPNGLQILFSDSPDLNSFRVTDFFNTRAGQAFSRLIPVRAQWYRLRYANGPNAQSVFQLQTIITPRNQEDVDNPYIEIYRTYRGTTVVSPSTTTELIRLSDTDKIRAIRIRGFGAHLNELNVPIGGHFPFQIILRVGVQTTAAVGIPIVYTEVSNTSGKPPNWVPVILTPTPGDDITVSVFHAHFASHTFSATIEVLER